MTRVCFRTLPASFIAGGRAKGGHKVDRPICLHTVAKNKFSTMLRSVTPVNGQFILLAAHPRLWRSVRPAAKKKHAHEGKCAAGRAQAPVQQRVWDFILSYLNSRVITTSHPHPDPFNSFIRVEAKFCQKIKPSRRPPESVQDPAGLRRRPPPPHNLIIHFIFASSVQGQDEGQMKGETSPLCSGLLLGRCSRMQSWR